MKIDDMVTDGLGWVDDFRAQPGECGSPLARKIYLQSLIQQGTNIQQLKQMGFSRDMVSEINTRLVDEEYGPKPGDMIQMVTGQPDYKTNPQNNGVLIDIVQKHSHAHITNPSRRVATVLTSSGEIVTWPLDSHYEIKVINESR
jgi:hypothetical protein